MELSASLPLKTDDVNQLDKASVMRMTIAFLKIREMLKFGGFSVNKLPVNTHFVHLDSLADR